MRNDPRRETIHYNYEKQTATKMWVSQWVNECVYKCACVSIQ